MPFSKENLSRLEKALEGLNPIHRETPQKLPFSVAADFPRGVKNLYLRTDLGALDCLGQITGVGDFAEVNQQSVLVELPIGPCKILSLSALIQAKGALDRTQDKVALVHLREIQRKKLE